MKVKVKSLRHHPKNAEIYSLDDLDDLASSIEDVGLLTPLVIDQHNQVISGNRRLACIRQLGWTDVEVSQTFINDEYAELFIVHHNKQRIKTYRELLNEYHALNRIHRRSQGKRTDLQTDGVRVNRRKEMAEAIGLKETTLVRLLVVEKEYPELVDTLDKGNITLYAAWNYCRRQKRFETSGKVSRQKHQTKMHSDENHHDDANFLSEDDWILLEKFIEENSAKSKLDRNHLQNLLRKVRRQNVFQDAAD